MKIRIILADDHTLIRECLRVLLEKCPDIELVAEAANGTDAVRLALELRPDLVLMDIGMKGLNGIEATRRIVSACPGIKILILSMHGDRRFLAEALNAGAGGFLLKNCVSKEILSAVRAVMDNGSYLSPELQAMAGRERRDADWLMKTVLTPREHEILLLLAQGETSKEIAVLLQISAKTVETHRAHIMKKLEINSIAALTKYAIREGFLLLD